MKQTSKIVEIPSVATITQMQNALDDFIKNGYEFKQVFSLGAKTYAIFIKTISN